MFAAVVILILCSPLILGPLVIPRLKAAKTEKGLERLRGEEGERLPQGLAVIPAIRPGRKVKILCEVQVDANLTKVDCGGVLHHVVEGAPDAPKPLATICFLCGRFEKSATTSRTLGPAFSEVNDITALERLVRHAKYREERERSRSVA